MSDQHEVGDSTSLEDVFNSQQFGRTSGTADLEEVVVTWEFGVAARVAAAVLHSNASVGPHNPPLEGVLDSARVGGPLTLVAPLQARTPAPGALPAEEGAVAPLDLRRREHNRYRTIAAVSGFAAAALVVAGVTSGTVQQRPPTISAGMSGIARPPGGFVSSWGAAPVGTAAPSGPAPTATLTAAAGGTAGPSVFAAAARVGPYHAAGGQANLGRSSGADATAPPAPPTGVTPPGPGGATSPPPVPSSGGNPFATVTTAVASTVTAAGTSGTSVVDQFGGSIPTTTPVTSAASTAPGGGGQAVSSTTG